MENKEKIYEYLKSISRLDLMPSESVDTSYDEILNMLSLEEWEDEKFKPLLTSDIWKHKTGKVKKLLEMPEWENEKYTHLLKPSILKVSLINIRELINLYKKYGIDDYITCASLKRSVIKQGILIDYLTYIGVPLTIKRDGKTFLNPVLSVTTKKLLEVYGIDLPMIEKGIKEGKDFSKLL